MGEIKVVTLNLLSDLSRWKQRRNLLVQELVELDPDVIALQEVKLPDNTAQWVADQIGYSQVYLSPKSGAEHDKEGIALISRRPVEAQETLDLEYQFRVAQFIRLNLDGQTVIVANGHLFWQPGDSEKRLIQVERLLAWLHGQAGKPPLIVCGDFNSAPNTSAIQRMEADLNSAFASAHGREPDYTWPTPLPHAPFFNVRTLLGFFVLLRPRYLFLPRKNTLDYIFVDRRLAVRESRVVLNIPAADNPRLYPSDHFGIYARVETNEL